jgi:hypothetical protein
MHGFLLVLAILASGVWVSGAILALLLCPATIAKLPSVQAHQVSGGSPNLWGAAVLICVVLGSWLGLEWMTRAEQALKTKD